MLPRGCRQAAQVTKEEGMLDRRSSSVPQLINSGCGVWNGSKMAKKPGMHSPWLESSISDYFRRMRKASPELQRRFVLMLMEVDVKLRCI